MNDTQPALPHEDEPQVNAIRVCENGPFVLNAPFTLDGQVHPAGARLCRCGRSGTKPFCDDTHEGGFVASGEPPERPSTVPMAEVTGPVELRPLPNGPLMVRGGVVITSASGREVYRVRTVALCRCGGSRNMPYCDGNHTGVGFKG